MRVPQIPGMLDKRFSKKTLLISSADRLSGDTLTNINITFPTGINNVVYADWSSCSIPGYCFRIAQFPNNGLTTTHTGQTTYWRFIGALTNQSNYDGSVFPDSQWAVLNISSLNVIVFNPNGTVASGISADWVLEINVWCFN